MREHGSRWYLLLACLVAGLGGLLFGFDTAVISGAEGLVVKQYHLSEAMEGWIVSSALLGCLIGASIAGVLADRLGRKPVLLLAAVLFVVCSIGSAMPSMPWHLVVARIIGGTGIGIASMLSPMYIAEISPARLRGGLISTYQLAITFGVVIAYFSNYGVAALASHHASLYGHGLWHWIFVGEMWRGMLLLGVVPAMVLFVLLFFVPESPRWLTRQGRVDEALAILSRVNGVQQAGVEMREIETTLAQESGSLRQLWAPGTRIALAIGILLPFLSQVCGINAIIYYGPKLLTTANVESDSTLLWQVMLGTVNVVFTLVAVFTVDKLGRKPLLLIGIAGVGVTLFGAGVLFWLAAPPVAILVAFGLFLACFSLSYGPVCWIIIAEIFPTAIRGRAMSISVFSLWTGCILVGQTLPLLLKYLGPAPTFWHYASTTLPALVFVAFCITETKGKTLEQIEHHFIH